jgi:hypothetical protein
MFQRISWQGMFIWIQLAVFLAGFAASAQSTNPPGPGEFAIRAKREFVEARSRYQTNSNDVEAAWLFARACFDLGEFARNNSERAEVAETGIAVSRKLVSQHPNSVEGRYYLAMNMGQLARTKTLGALRLVDLMEVEFNAARKLNEKFDYAGPWRNLGLLYLEAPAFGSIGSRSKARQHLRRAVELAPNYPENRLILTEAYLRWGDEAAAAREFKTLAAGWAQAKTNFSGDKWVMSWIDWQKRYDVLKGKLGDAALKLETPKSER